jgi:hypothetical protein
VIGAPPPVRIVDAKRAARLRYIQELAGDGDPIRCMALAMLCGGRIA